MVKTWRAHKQWINAITFSPDDKRVATTAFEQAARAQSEALGFEPAIVYVPHPIQNRTDEEIRAIADAAMDAILAEITTG